ncbi:amidase family protein [Nonomuraea sp. H19]|uniref:amidase family protein n=1 Tax=Nonomuraea sp. H19 TaxID=3452206 RepID=UPI003F8AA12B
MSPSPGRTVAALAQDLRQGRSTSAELTGRALDAIAAARRADEELAGGADRGPLQRVPVAVKDVIPVAGLPLTMGSRHFAGYVPEADAGCVTLLRRGRGGVLAGDAGGCLLAYRCLTSPDGHAGTGLDAGPVRVAWLDPAGLLSGDPRVVSAVRAATVTTCRRCRPCRSPRRRSISARP